MPTSNKMKVTTIRIHFFSFAAWRHLLVSFSWGSYCQAVQSLLLFALSCFWFKKKMVGKVL